MSAEELLGMAPGWNHWRLWIPATYYCTHALAPLMAITGRMPRSVNSLGFSNPEFSRKNIRFSDPGAVTLVKTDSGAVFRLFGIMVPGHSIWYRVHGTRGSMENVRSRGYWGNGKVRIVHEPYNLCPGEKGEIIYKPDFPAWARKKAADAGHGGGDFFTNHFFAEAIRTGKQPYLNVYRSTAMSAVAIQAWRSALDNGNNYPIPDFSSEKERKKYENDHWSPFYAKKPRDQAPSNLANTRQWTPGMRKKAIAAWKKIGFNPGKPE
ncbi:MAG: hypothetical protein A2487_18510 [Candidatus Raymondbacteria bacterium RifOxyC12_full_50_8]|nr:MAG: hypothetical protein A2487_18510 [Candidatus Raymondbacteria bacterium RifOxyC12_full_50_8]